MRKLLYLLATVTVSLLMVNCGGLNGPYSTKNLQKVLPPKNYNTTITEVVNAIYGKSKDEAIKIMKGYDFCECSQIPDMEQDPDLTYFVPNKYKDFIDYINRFYGEGDAEVIKQMESDLAEISNETWPMNPIVVIAIFNNSQSFGYYMPIEINDYFDQVQLNVNWLYDNMDKKIWNYWVGGIYYLLSNGDEDEQQYLEGAGFPSGYYPTHSDYVNSVNALKSKNPIETIIEENCAVMDMATEEAKDAYYFNASKDNDGYMIIYYSRCIDDFDE
ncbi:MAG: hypothetical protein MSH47_03460 [Bacteroidales bacterium]|nr:hypothetical protein [Bacteroidales bacterium]